MADTVTEIVLEDFDLEDTGTVANAGSATITFQAATGVGGTVTVDGGPAAVPLAAAQPTVSVSSAAATANAQPAVITLAAANATTDPAAGDLTYPGLPANSVNTSGGCCNAAVTNISGGVIHDFGGAAGCNSPGSSPWGPPGTTSQWGIAETWRRVEWKLRVDLDHATHGHFWAMQTSFTGSGENFYAGLQKNSSIFGSPQKIALFSVWGALSSVAGSAPGAQATPFDEFGTGYSVQAPYAWTLGATYTLRVEADTARGADWWRLDVIADTTGAVSNIGSVQVPAAWGDIDGAYALAFSEWFTNTGITSCLQVPRVTAFFGTPGYSDTLSTGTPVGGLAMGGGFPYLGYPGSLQQLPSPSPGYEPVDQIRAVTHELLASNVRDRLLVRRRFTLNWPAMTDANYQLVRSLTRLPGPYRYHDPLEGNLLTVNQSTGSDELRTTEGAMARFQGTLTSSTAQFRSWTRSFAWNSTTALSITGRGIYLYTQDVTPDRSWAAVRPNVQYTASGYLRATSTVSFQCGIDWMTAAGAFISVSLGTGAAVSTANFSGRFTCTATAPATAAYGIPFFINTTTPGTTLTVYLDEAQFEEGASASSFRIGAGTPPVSVDSLGHTIAVADATVGYAVHAVELVLLEVE